VLIFLPAHEFYIVTRNNVVTEISKLLTASVIAMMMEDVSTTETSVSFYRAALRNIPEDSHILKRSHKSLKISQNYEIKTSSQ
jgi:hypothetical protein